ncbi:MAG: preprotein translocase subunit SecE [Nitrospinae bacterium]|nr:preprotein translocase subunit SecE [Nitrospinota bacterium]MBF0635541.1 preprotein translocase subunit SecE [Nitrospinota bacterium]
MVIKLRESAEGYAQFLKEVKMEAKKATFPSKKDTVATTGVVIVFVLIMSMYLGVVDFLLSKIMTLAVG